MKRIRFECLRVIFFRGAVKDARARIVNDDGCAHHDERPDRNLDFGLLEEETLDGFVDDPGQGGEQQNGLEQGRDVFDLAVTEGCSLSAGLSAMRTANKVINAATRSRAEWAASARIPSEFVRIPTIILKEVNPTAAMTELSAAVVLSFCAWVCDMISSMCKNEVACRKFNLTIWGNTTLIFWHRLATSYPIQMPMRRAECHRFDDRPESFVIKG